MSNSIFDFLGIDLDATLKNLVELKNELIDTYNEKVNEVKNNVQKYDLNTQEGYEAFINEAADIRRNLEGSDSYFSETMIKILDRLVEKVMKEHNDKVTTKKTDTIKELVDAEVNRNNKECSCTGKEFRNTDVADEKGKEYECECDEIDRPSRHLTYKQSRNISRLVDEYMEEMVEPYVPNDVDDSVLEDMAGGLFEFAAWLLNKEEE